MQREGNKRIMYGKSKLEAEFLRTCLYQLCIFTAQLVIVESVFQLKENHNLLSQWGFLNFISLLNLQGAEESASVKKILSYIIFPFLLCLVVLVFLFCLERIRVRYSGHEEVENCFKIYWHEDI